MNPSPIAFEFAGESKRRTLWMFFDSENDQILLYGKSNCGLDSYIGTLGPDGSFLLEFESNGWIRTKFKVLDPQTKKPLGNAWCLKSDAKTLMNHII
jgi:hypothetical protein